MNFSFTHRGVDAFCLVVLICRCLLVLDDLESVGNILLQSEIGFLVLVGFLLLLFVLLFKIVPFK